MVPLDCVELRTYSSRYACSCSSWRSKSATFREASPMTRLKSVAVVEAISWIGSNRLDLRMGSALSDGCRGRRRELRHELLEIRVTSLDSHRFVHVLAQEFDDFGPLLHCQIHSRVGTAPISPDGNQVAVLLISGIHLPEPVREIELFSCGYLVHCPADRRLDVDGR